MESFSFKNLILYVSPLKSNLSQLAISRIIWDVKIQIEFIRIMIEQLVLNLEAEKLVNLSYIIGKYISALTQYLLPGQPQPLELA